MSSHRQPEAINEEPTGGWSQDGDLPGCDRLERRWLLWHGFMTEHAHLDAWLRLAEQAAASQDCARVTYAQAKDDVRRFERLRCEAGSVLVHLDALTQRNRTLSALFRGAMRARLLAAARDCRQRWERLDVKLESVSARLKGLLCEWEEFEEETEELAIWLAEMEAGLQHMTGNTCDKLRELQSFQQSVCVNWARVNGVLERGEALIERGAPSDAQRVERRLLELLRHCSHVYCDIARAHTRLLSMRLVFEDDLLLTPPPDSGCPSETLFEEEGALDKISRGLPASAKELHHHHHHRPPSSPSHEHLEWDPSVDVGRSVSYYSASTGGQSQEVQAQGPRESPKRRSYISSLSSDVIGSDIVEQEDALHSKASPDVFSNRSDIKSPRRDRRVTSSTPQHDGAGRVRAWLGAVPPSCSKAVQTDTQCLDMAKWDVTHMPSCHGDACDDNASRASSPSPDLRRQTPQEEEESCCDEEGQRLRAGRVSPPCPAAAKRLALAAVAAVSLLACLLWSFLQPPCHRRAAVAAPPPGLHLRYVNGPPPT